MRLSLELALVIDKELSELGYARNLSILDKDFCIFTSEQLSRIEELNLSKISSLEGIELLPNLRKLVIKSPDFSSVAIDVDIDDSTINAITDFSVIGKLSNLEELEIINDINITSLDLRGLDKLKRVIIINNPNLVELKGLEEKKKLEEVMVYGSEITNPFDINTYMENTKGTSRNVLDVSMYISMVNKDLELASLLSVSSLVGDTHLQFAERIGFLDFALLRPEHLKEMYSNLSKLFLKNSLYSKDDAEKIKYVYRYVNNRLSFDREGLEEREKEYRQLLSEHGSLPDFRKKKFSSFHNSYVAYYLKKANCEGYVNLMRFMLSMLGVKSFNVHCRDRRSNILTQNHSILRVQCEGEWFYCNPKYDGSKEVFMGKLEDLIEDYEFNIYERIISKGEKRGNNNAEDFNQKIK